MGQLLLGIDIGTAACKATLVDPEAGRTCTSKRTYELCYPRHGWVEQNPQDWWLALQGALDDLASFMEPGDSIKAVSVGGTNALVAVDDHGEPVRNAIIFSDVRSQAIVEDLNQKGFFPKIFSISGNRVAPGAFSLPSILWMREHEPELYRKTHKFLVPAGYIVHKLTGVFSMDYSRASFTLLFDVFRHAWSKELCQALEIDEDKLPAAVSSTKFLGTACAGSRLRGLSADTPVTAGCVDTVAASFATGSVSPGDTNAIFGTTGRICVVLGERAFDARFVNCCHALPGLWLVTAAMNGTGTSLQWFKKHLGHMEVLTEQTTGIDAYHLLDLCAQNSKVGAGGVIYLPYLSGERSPIWDSHARGVFLGISSSTAKSDLIRAILEGTAFSFRHNLEIMESLGIRIEKIMVTGGGSKSHLWMQILADITGHQVDVLEVKDGETLGVALLGGIATNMFDVPEEALQKFVRKVDFFEPNQKNRSMYDNLYAVYLDCYRRLMDVFAELSKVSFL